MSDIFYIKQPQGLSLPFLFNMPHSGENYSESFLKRCAVPHATLCQQEDFAVDKLFSEAPDYGATLMAATFPRCFIDLNREAYELDPEMFEGPLPPFINSTTTCVLNGIGTIARKCPNGEEIYTNKLTWQEAKARIENYYMPYHQALQNQIDRIKKQFGWVAILDCHSMPAKDSAADIVIGTRFGGSTSPALRDFICQLWTSLGYRLSENNPYAGGFITRHYGKPAQNQFAIQIELNRKLYMDEATHAPSKNWEALRADIKIFMRQLSAFEQLSSAAQ